MFKKFFLLISFHIISSEAKKIDIHFFGDSHTFFCFTNSNAQVFDYDILKDEDSLFKFSDDIDASFFIHLFISKTMFRIGRDGLDFLNIKQYPVQENDIVLFLFGEVDARAHIGKQRDEKNRDLEEILESLVQNYMTTIKNNLEQYNKLTCVVSSIMPPCDYQRNIYLPFYGILEDRVLITQSLNNCLERHCQLNGFLFLDIYSLYAKADGSMKWELTNHGDIHADPLQNKEVKNALISLLLNDENQKTL